MCVAVCMYVRMHVRVYVCLFTTVYMPLRIVLLVWMYTVFPGQLYGVLKNNLSYEICAAHDLQHRISADILCELARFQKTRSHQHSQLLRPGT